MLKNYSFHRSVNEIIDFFRNIKNDNDSYDQSIGKNIGSDELFQYVPVECFQWLRIYLIQIYQEALKMTKDGMKLLESFYFSIQQSFPL